MIDIQVRQSNVVLLDSFFYDFTLSLALKKKNLNGSVNRNRQKIIYVKSFYFMSNFLLVL